MSALLEFVLDISNSLGPEIYNFYLFFPGYIVSVRKPSLASLGTFWGHSDLSGGGNKS